MEPFVSKTIRLHHRRGCYRRHMLGKVFLKKKKTLWLWHSFKLIDTHHSGQDDINCWLSIAKLQRHWQQHNALVVVRRVVEQRWRRKQRSSWDGGRHGSPTQRLSLTRLFYILPSRHLPHPSANILAHYTLRHQFSFSSWPMYNLWSKDQEVKIDSIRANTRTSERHRRKKRLVG